jgi:hypothetical protein
MSAAEDCIRQTIEAWPTSFEDDLRRPSIQRAIANELRRDNAALADLDSVWRDTDTASLAALMARAEKAEAELDRLREQMVEMVHKNSRSLKR